MPPVGFEHTSSGGERPQTYALDRAATGTDNAVSKSFSKLLAKIPVFPNGAFLLRDYRKKNKIIKLIGTSISGTGYM
jgi:hypothetical protein